MSRDYGKQFSIFLRGNLKLSKGVISIDIPHKEMNYNLFRIRISEVSFECKEPFQFGVIALLSTNYVNEIRFDKYKSEIQYNPHFTHILLKGEIQEKQSIEKNENWFFINSFEEKLKIYFR